MRVLHLDIETYSSAPLPKCGVYRYCGSPDFEILLLSYAFDDGPVVTADLACGEQMATLKDMRAAGLVSGREFVRSAQFIAERFSPVWGGLYPNSG